MKRSFVFLCISCLVLSSACPALAGGIDNKHNFSAEYIRTLNRNAATDSADAVVYNPAGVVRLKDGFHFSISGQYAFKEYSNTYTGTEYDTDEPDIIPGLFGLYKKNWWAAFAAFTMPCGGGTVDYEDGSKTTSTIAQSLVATPLYDQILAQRMEAESFYYGFTMGGAWAVNDTVSLSLGWRYVDAEIEQKGSARLHRTGGGEGTVVIDYEEADAGWTGILGLNIAPTQNLNIGLRYETKTSLCLKTDESRDDIGLVTDGSKRRRDLPALLGLGLSHNVTPKLRAEADLTCYLNNDAKWDDDLITSANETEKSNGYDVGVAFEYAFSPRLEASLGYMYTETGISPENMSAEAPQLDAHTVAAGFAYELVTGLDINLGALHVFYDDETTSDGTQLEKDVTIFAVGFQYRL